MVDLAAKVPTGAFILGMSRLDQARPSDDTEAIETLRSRNPGPQHVNDALITQTSMVEGCALVTAETKRLPGKAREVGIEVLHPLELLAELGYRALEPEWPVRSAPHQQTGQVG